MHGKRFGVLILGLAAAACTGESSPTGWDASAVYGDVSDFSFEAASTLAPGFAAISGGGSYDEAFTCALDVNGKAWCWGLNDDGQLGTGDEVSSSTPVAVSGNKTFTALAAGYEHVCAIDALGAAWCWGDGSDGALGTGNTSDYPIPTAVAGGLAFKQISAGYGHTCAIATDGTGWCWGYGFDGQLGTVDGGNSSTPVAVAMPPGVTFTQISAGYEFSCALGNNGGAYCWGYGGEGSLGYGDTFSKATPFQVYDFIGTKTWTRLASASGYNQHMCAIEADGSAWCWGPNGSGELGNGYGSHHQYAPTPVSGGLTFTDISVGTEFTCALASGGAAWCWGDGSEGQLGNGDTEGSPVPVAVSGSGSYVRLTAAAYHACAIGADGQGWCWGADDEGQLGNDEDKVDSSVPVKVLQDIGSGGGGGATLTEKINEYLTSDSSDKRALLQSAALLESGNCSPLRSFSNLLKKLVKKGELTQAQANELNQLAVESCRAG